MSDTNVITQNQQAVVIGKPQPTACKTIPHRWMVVMQLHLTGKNVKEIADHTKYCENSVYRILNHEDSLAVRQRLLDTTQQEFEALFPKVVASINKALSEGSDPKDQAVARAQWLKAHGKFGSNSGVTNVNITAEDVVTNILNGNKQ